MGKRSEKVAWSAALVVFVAHAIGNPHYGYFRDELYFIICGFHPAFGYVDQPPIAPLLAAGSQLFGHSLFALRLIPAAFAGAGVYATCRLASALGGDEYAEVLAAVAFACTGVLTSFGMKVGPDMAGLWLWPLIALYMLRIVRGGDPRWWIAVGLAAGVAFETKYTLVFFAIAMVVGLALTQHRRVLFSGWFVAGVAVAIALALPNVIWQAVNNFPMLELLRNGHDEKNIHASPLLYVFQQILITNLFFWPLWVIGLVAVLRDGAARFLGYAYVLLMAMMMVLGGKDYYPADFYPILLAAGAVAVARWIHRPVWRAVVVTAVAIAGLIFVPFSLPVLSEQAMAAYSVRVQSALGVHKSVLQNERGANATLPNDWADMHGWPELVAQVAATYNRLPPAERWQTGIFTGNYGEAAAIDFFGPALGLPPALSGHNNYWLWGPGLYNGSTLLEVGGHCFADEHAYASATVVAYIDDPWAMSYERHRPIALCRGARMSLQQLWPKLRSYE
ncbi:MAG TPA: glycosyltransferase family 39 protein [Candidatus Tumulicola sp.]